MLLIRNPPFKATGSAATILTDFDNVDVGLASRREGNSVYLSLRRHKESDVNLASLIEESALNFGGVGGGHKAAAGGKIPVNMFDEFLLEIRRRLPKEQLKRTRELDVESMDTKMIKRKLFREIIERKRAEEELRESEKKYYTLFENASDAVFICDTETGKILYANKKAEKLTGKCRDELIGAHQSELHPPDDVESTKKGFMDDVRHDGTVNKEVVVMRKDGTRIPVLISANTFKLGRKKVIQGIFHDITERKRAEETLRESEKRFRDIAENTREWIWEVDAKGKYIFASPAIEKILGYKPEEVLKKRFYDLFHPEDREKLKKAAFEAFAKKQPFREFVNRNVHKSGETVWLSTSGVPIIDEKGNLLGYRGADTDITERKRAEEEIRKSEERYRSLVETLPDVIFSLSEDGTFTSLNSAFEKITGWSRAEWLGKSFVTLIHPDDLSLAMESFQKTLRGESPSLHKLRILSKFGEYYLGEFMSMPQIKDGKVVGEFGIAYDITERNRLEMALEKRMHDLGKRVKELRCLYNISEMVNKPGVSLEGIIQGTVDLIPPAWQYPEIACARITIKGKEYETKNFKETVWRQVSNIVSHDEQIGAVEVYYLKERPESDEGPFLKEERSLINAIAEQLGRITGRKKAEDAVFKEP